MMRLAVLLTCYNRYEITIENLGRLICGLDRCEITYEVYLLDDASPDETGRRVNERFPRVHVFRDEIGDLFWNRGMRLISRKAAEDGPFDAYLLFNDDVAVDVQSVRDFIILYRKYNGLTPTAVAAATRASSSDRITYSGFRMPNKNRPLRLERVTPENIPIPIDTFNGNFVMIPASSFEDSGGFDPYFLHQFGDIDLGLTIKRRGERRILFPGTIGICDDNGGSVPSRHGLVERFRMGLVGREDPRQRAYFIYKHSPSKMTSILAIAGMIARRIWVLAANKPHVARGSSAAAVDKCGANK